MKKTGGYQYVEEKAINGEKLMKVSSQKIRLSPIHRSNGALTSITDKGKLCKGSAILISKNIILTAAHNIYDKISGTRNKDFKFYLAANGVTQKYYQIQSYKYPPQYQTCLSGKYDYALMILKDSPKDPINHNTFCQLSLSCQCSIPLNINQIQLQIYGYPFGNEFPNFTPHNKQETKLELYQYGLSKTGRVDEYKPTKHRITYLINTYPGQSGCAVVSYGNIIAIHTGNLSQTNIARLITSDLIVNLQSWVKQLGGQQFKINFNSLCKHNQHLNQKQTIQKQTIQNQTMETSLSLFRQGDKLYKECNFNYAITIFKRSLKIRQLILGRKSTQCAQVIAYIGTVYNRQGDYTSALKNLLEALDIYNVNNKKDSIEVAKVVNNIGNTYYFQQQYTNSIHYYKECIRICQQLKAKENIYPYSLSGAGAASYINKDYKTATQFFQKSLKVHEEYKLNSEECAIWLAKCYKEIKQAGKMLAIITKYKLNTSSV